MLHSILRSVAILYLILAVYQNFCAILAPPVWLNPRGGGGGVCLVNLSWGSWHAPTYRGECNMIGAHNNFWGRGGGG
jgi:hypothetical protein